MGWSGLYQLLASSNLRMEGLAQTTVPEKACPRGLLCALDFHGGVCSPVPPFLVSGWVSLSFMGGEAWKPPQEASLAGSDATAHVDNDVTRSPSPALTPDRPRAWALSWPSAETWILGLGAAAGCLWQVSDLEELRVSNQRKRPRCQVNAEFNPIWQTREPLGCGEWGAPILLAGWRRGARKPAEIRFSGTQGSKERPLWV